jgi:hypothetical protein
MRQTRRQHGKSARCVARISHVKDRPRRKPEKARVVKNCSRNKTARQTLFAPHHQHHHAPPFAHVDSAMERVRACRTVFTLFSHAITAHHQAPPPSPFANLGAARGANVRCVARIAPARPRVHGESAFCKDCACKTACRTLFSCHHHRHIDTNTTTTEGTRYENRNNGSCSWPLLFHIACVHQRQNGREVYSSTTVSAIEAHAPTDSAQCWTKDQ